jgi:hypothetical protein
MDKSNMDKSDMDKSNMKKSNEPRKPTEAQIDANRRNAQKSTGPRTPEGRAASSRNRLLHGLRANKHILLDEDPDEFLILLKDLHDRFRPVGDGEEELVMRIASGQWRLHRTLPMEAGIYRERLQAVAAEDYARKRELVNHKRNHQLNPERVPPRPARPRRPPDPRPRRPIALAGTRSPTSRATKPASSAPSLPAPTGRVPGCPACLRRQPGGPAQSASSPTVNAPFQSRKCRIARRNPPRTNELPFEPKK